MPDAVVDLGELARAAWWWFTQPIGDFVAQFDPAQELTAAGAPAG